MRADRFAEGNEPGEDDIEDDGPEPDDEVGPPSRPHPAADIEGYPLVYHTADGGVLCPGCANGHNGSEAHERSSDREWRLVGVSPHYEGPPIPCDHCGAEVESAYGDPDDPDEDEGAADEENDRRANKKYAERRARRFAEGDDEEPKLGVPAAQQPQPSWARAKGGPARVHRNSRAHRDVQLGLLSDALRGDRSALPKYIDWLRENGNERAAGALHRRLRLGFGGEKNEYNHSNLAHEILYRMAAGLAPRAGLSAGHVADSLINDEPLALDRSRASHHRLGTIMEAMGRDVAWRGENSPSQGNSPSWRSGRAARPPESHEGPPEGGGDEEIPDFLADIDAEQHAEGGPGTPGDEGEHAWGDGGHFGVPYRAATLPSGATRVLGQHGDHTTSAGPEPTERESHLLDNALNGARDHAEHCRARRRASVAAYVERRRLDRMAERFAEGRDLQPCQSCKGTGVNSGWHGGGTADYLTGGSRSIEHIPRNERGEPRCPECKGTGYPLPSDRMAERFTDGDEREAEFQRKLAAIDAGTAPPRSRKRPGAGADEGEDGPDADTRQRAQVAPRVSRLGRGLARAAGGIVGAGMGIGAGLGVHAATGSPLLGAASALALGAGTVPALAGAVRRLYDRTEAHEPGEDDDLPEPNAAHERADWARRAHTPGANARRDEEYAEDGAVSALTAQPRRLRRMADDVPGEEDVATGHTPEGDRYAVHQPTGTGVRLEGSSGRFRSGQPESQPIDRHLDARLLRAINATPTRPRRHAERRASVARYVERRRLEKMAERWRFAEGEEEDRGPRRDDLGTPTARTPRESAGSAKTRRLGAVAGGVTGAAYGVPLGHVTGTIGGAIADATGHPGVGDAFRYGLPGAFGALGAAGASLAGHYLLDQRRHGSDEPEDEDFAEGDEYEVRERDVVGGVPEDDPDNIGPEEGAPPARRPRRMQSPDDLATVEHLDRQARERALRAQEEAKQASAPPEPHRFAWEVGMPAGDNGRRMRATYVAHLGAAASGRDPAALPAYADWLEENGHDEAAARMRHWVETFDRLDAQGRGPGGEGRPMRLHHDGGEIRVPAPSSSQSHHEAFARDVLKRMADRLMPLATRGKFTHLSRPFAPEHSSWNRALLDTFDLPGGGHDERKRLTTFRRDRPHEEELGRVLNALGYPVGWADGPAQDHAERFADAEDDANRNNARLGRRQWQEHQRRLKADMVRRGQAILEQQQRPEDLTTDEQEEAANRRAGRKAREVAESGAGRYAEGDEDLPAGPPPPRQLPHPTNRAQAHTQDALGASAGLAGLRVGRGDLEQTSVPGKYYGSREHLEDTRRELRIAHRATQRAAVEADRAADAHGEGDSEAAARAHAAAIRHLESAQRSLYESGLERSPNEDVASAVKYALRTHNDARVKHHQAAQEQRGRLGPEPPQEEPDEHAEYAEGDEGDEAEKAYEEYERRRREQDRLDREPEIRERRRRQAAARRAGRGPDKSGTGQNPAQQHAEGEDRPSLVQRLLAQLVPDLRSWSQRRRDAATRDILGQLREGRREADARKPRGGRSRPEQAPPADYAEEPPPLSEDAQAVHDGLADGIHTSVEGLANRSGLSLEQAQGALHELVRSGHVKEVQARGRRLYHRADSAFMGPGSSSDRLANKKRREYEPADDTYAEGDDPGEPDGADERRARREEEASDERRRSRRRQLGERLGREIDPATGEPDADFAEEPQPSEEAINATRQAHQATVESGVGKRAREPSEYAHILTDDLEGAGSHPEARRLHGQLIDLHREAKSRLSDALIDLEKSATDDDAAPSPHTRAISDAWYAHHYAMLAHHVAAESLPKGYAEVPHGGRRP